jgi:hypothetical protein
VPRLGHEHLFAQVQASLQSVAAVPLTTDTPEHGSTVFIVTSSLTEPQLVQ